MCSLDQITAAYRAAATSRQAPLPWNSKGPRFRLLIAALREYGWHMDSPWVFSHPKLDLTFSLDPAQPTFPECQPALEHALRESWRCSLFGAWKRSKRRDAHACKDIEYNSERCRLARLAARDRDARVIMSGGFISPLLFFVQCRSSGAANATSHQKRIACENAQPKCPLCGHNEASLDHMVWQCHARYNLVSWNLPSKPQCPLANRLCWPLGNDVDSDRALVRLFCQMRKTCLYHRWIAPD